MPRLKTETMDRLFGFIVLAVTLVSCSKGGFGPSSGFPDDGQPAHGMIVLGKRLENPYKTENIAAAIASVYPARDRVEVKPTHLYVRFLPVDQGDFDLISDLDLSDYPLDYEILKDGDYYHDPQIDDEKVTWQYAVVPHDYVFPDIYYEVIDECFITENDAPERSADGIDWEAVEREAYRLTGNADMLEAAGARGNKVHPSGRITIVDDKVNGGKPFGLAGVRVRCNTFVKYSHAYTDRDGYYTIPKKYSAKVRYRLIYKNEKGFAIGFNKLLVPASTSALGKASPSGLDYTVTKNSGRTMFSRSVVNNAAYDYISRCSADDMGITPPPSDLRIWLFQNLRSRDMQAEYLGEKKPQYAGRLLSKDLHLADYDLPGEASWAGRTLAELNFGKRFGVHVVSILRGKKRINIPGASIRLFPGDKIQVIGTDAELNVFGEEMAKACALDEDVVEKSEMILRQFRIDGDSPFLNRSIRESGIREKYHCLVVGVEREENVLRAPDPNEPFLEGDVVWIVGESTDVYRLAGNDREE